MEWMRRRAGLDDETQRQTIGPRFFYSRALPTVFERPSGVELVVLSFVALL